jgi:hypothetical protein
MVDTTMGTLGSLAKLTCACCGNETVDRGGYCGHCQMPFDMSRAVNDRGTPARFVSILGRSGAGKTIYLGFLIDMLTKGTQNLRGLPHGSFSLATQQETVYALENRRFPEKTASESDSWQWVHCEVSHVKKPKRFVDIMTPDFAGEAIEQEIEYENTYPLIRSVVSRSEALLILFDSNSARDNARDEDFFAMKLMSYIAKIQGKSNGRRWRKLRVPISIVLTKADSCPEAMDNPAAFAAANLPGLVQACERNFSQYEFFAAGVVGSSTIAVDGYGRRMHLPLHTEVRGIMEPLEWIMKSM